MNQEIFDILGVLNCEVPSLNRGGCGIVTYALLKRLMKDGHLKPKSTDWAIVFAHNWADSFNHNAVALKPRSKKTPRSCAHILLRIGDTYYDSIGQYKSVEDHKAITLPVAMAIETKSINKLLLAINHSSWNPAFDREDNIPMIEFRLKVDLSEINK